MHFNENTTLYVYIIESVFVAPPFAFNKIIRSAILLCIELLSSSVMMTFDASLYHTSHAHFHISSFKHSIWLQISFVTIFQTFSVEFISGDFPGHFRTGITVHSRNVLALLELKMYGMAHDNA